MTATDTPGSLSSSADVPAATDLAPALTDDGSPRADWGENALYASESAQAYASERVWQSLVDANTAVYLKTMQQYAAAYGAPVPDAVTDPAVLGDIEDRATVSADSIVNTRAARMDALAAQYDTAEETRAAYQDWRSGQNARIAAFESGFTASAALDDFFTNNPLLADGATEHVEPPETDQTDICMQAIAMGEVPYGTLPDFPAHLNCPHYVVRSTSPLADAALDPSALWLGQAPDESAPSSSDAVPTLAAAAWAWTPTKVSALMPGMMIQRAGGVVQEVAYVDRTPSGYMVGLVHADLGLTIDYAYRGDETFLALPATASPHDAVAQETRAGSPSIMAPDGSVLRPPTAPLVPQGAQLGYSDDPKMTAKQRAPLAGLRADGSTAFDSGFARVNQQLSPVWRDLLAQSGVTYLLTLRKPSVVEHDPMAKVMGLDNHILGVTIPHEDHVYLYGQNLARHYGPRGTEKDVGGDYTDHIANTITHESGHVLDRQLAGRMGARSKRYDDLSTTPAWRAIYDAHQDDAAIPPYMRYAPQEMFAEAFASYNGMGWLSPKELRTTLPEAAQYFDQLVDAVWPTGADAPSKPAGYQTPADRAAAPAPTATPGHEHGGSFAGRGAQTLGSYVDYIHEKLGLGAENITATEGAVTVRTRIQGVAMTLRFENATDLVAWVDKGRINDTVAVTILGEHAVPAALAPSVPEAMIPEASAMGGAVPLPSAAAITSSDTLDALIRAQAGPEWSPFTGAHYKDAAAQNAAARGAALRDAGLSPEQATALAERWATDRADIAPDLLATLGPSLALDPYTRLAALVIGSFDRDAGLRFASDVALQQVAAEMLAIPFEKKPYYNAAAWDAGQALAADPLVRSALGALLRQQYRATQDFLAAQGITSVAVYRGVKRQTGAQADAVAAAQAGAAPGAGYTARGADVVPNKPLTSFGVSPDIALAFGGVRSSDPASKAATAINWVGEVPASRILSLSLVGMGDPDDSEVIVAGSTGDLLSWVARGPSSTQAGSTTQSAPEESFAGTAGAPTGASAQDEAALAQALRAPAATLTWDPGAPPSSWSSYSDKAARTTRVVQERLDPFWQGLMAQAGEPAYITNRMPSQIDGRVATPDNNSITGLHTQGDNPAVYIFSLNIDARGTWDLLDHQAFAGAAAGTLVHEESHVLDHYLGPLLGATYFGGSPAPRLSDGDAFATIYGQSIVANLALPQYMRYNAHEAFAEGLATYLGFGDITPQRLAELAPDVTRYFDTIMGLAAQKAGAVAPPVQLGTLDLAALGAPARTPGGGLVADAGNQTAAQLDVDYVHAPQPPSVAFSYPPNPGLSPTERAVEERFGAQIASDVPGAIAAYRAQFGNVISTDEARALSPDYSASQESRSALALAVHEPASALVKLVYAQELTEPAGPGHVNTVLFTAGGSGAGKSSALQTVASAVASEAQIVFDTALSNTASAQKKIEQALAAGKDVHIVYVQRDPIASMVDGVLPRAMDIGRTVTIADHVAMHVGAQASVRDLSVSYADNPLVHFTYIGNDQGLGNATLLTRDQALGAPYDREQLIRQTTAAVEEAHRSGAISDSVYLGVLGTSGSGGGVSEAELVTRPVAPATAAPSAGAGTLLEDLRTQGGFTAQPFTHETPQDGFMVSPYPERELVLPLDAMTEDALVDYMARNADLLAQPDHYLGGWYNEQDGKVYLDVSIRAQGADQAEALARRYNQFAYYDLAKGESIDVPGRAA